ncbi:MAG TPA: dihydroorotate dehydrogenase electron transfer subunit [Spirochaetota bacterium]|nr:dihydroorotate dehydrogenase electron transfer subunit [Spirochaetota bacterium]
MAILLDKPQEVSQEHFLLKIAMKGANFAPGQFINIKTTEGTDPLLRRPFSIFDAEGDIAHIIVRVVGRGTSLISKMEKGEINVLGPLGKGFTLEKNKNLLLLGGGVGNAPLYFLARELKNRGNKITYIYAAKTKNYIFYEDLYRELADEFLLFTDDGSVGTKGVPTEVGREVISNNGFDRLYCCGPDPMMEKVVSIANTSVSVEVSMENYFGCGVGLCMGCTVDTIHGFKRACMDGPVFNGREVIWSKE